MEIYTCSLSDIKKTKREYFRVFLSPFCSIVLPHKLTSTSHPALLTEDFNIYVRNLAQSSGLDRVLGPLVTSVQTRSQTAGCDMRAESGGLISNRASQTHSEFQEMTSQAPQLRTVLSSGIQPAARRRFFLNTQFLNKISAEIDNLVKKKKQCQVSQ